MNAKLIIALAAVCLLVTAALVPAQPGLSHSAPHVISIAFGNAGVSHPFFVRLWSDGLVEVRHENDLGGCWSCDESYPFGTEWVAFGVVPQPSPGAKPVDLDFPFRGSFSMFVGYSDGTIYKTRIFWDGFDGCTGEAKTHCVLRAAVWELP